MRQVGFRRVRPVQAKASGLALAVGAEFSTTISHIAGNSSFVPKGVYRFKSHAEAQRQDELWLAAGMARKALEQAHG